MNNRNTAGKLGFIKDAEGIYRKGNFIYKNGRIIRESQIVPEGTIKDLKDDDFITLDECIRSILAYSTTIGDTNPRATNVYIDKIGNSYKPAKALSKNTVAVVMSNRQVMELKPRNVLDQDDNSKLKNKDKENKPAKAKVIKDFSKPVEFDKLKKESAGKRQFIVKTKNYESDPITANSESEALETFATQDDGDYSKFLVATPVGDIKESATKKVGKLKLKESESSVFDNYRPVKLIDSYEDTLDCVILLNNKHSVEDFQNAINKSREDHAEEIDKYGDDWAFIEEGLDDFDYYVVELWDTEAVKY